MGTTTSRLSLQPFLNFGTPRPLIVVSEEVSMPTLGTPNGNAANWTKVSREFHNGRELEAQTSSSETNMPVAIAVSVRSVAAPISPFALFVLGHEKSSFQDTKMWFSARCLLASQQKPGRLLRYAGVKKHDTSSALWIKRVRVRLNFNRTRTSTSNYWLSVEIRRSPPPRPRVVRGSLGRDR